MDTMNTATHNAPKKNDLVLVRDANEWGQINDLEKNATYFVIRKPTRELTQQKSKEFVEDVKSFLHEHRVLSEKQFEELNTRYGEPAKAKAKELRETMEKKFDELAKEFEGRVEQLETEYRARFGKKDAATTPEPHGAPGEMPTGEPTTAPKSASTSTTSTTSAKKPSTTRKTE